jgi:DNA-binding response OmpR family regulator
MKSRRILVVDDNRAWTSALADLLRMDGHEVRMAFDGDEAVGEAQGFQPEVVILDLRMPRMSGHDAARRLRREGESVRPLLIAVSAFDSDEDRQAALRSGFDHFLVKPIRVEQLNELFARVL